MESIHNKVVLLVGSDRIDGRSLALTLADHGADIVFIYAVGQRRLADRIKQQVQQKGRRCLSIPMSSDGKTWSNDVIGHVIDQLGRLDIFIDATALTGTLSSDKSGSDTGQQTLWSRPFFNFELVSAALRQMVDNHSTS